MHRDQLLHPQDSLSAFFGGNNEKLGLTLLPKFEYQDRFNLVDSAKSLENYYDPSFDFR